MLECGVPSIQYDEREAYEKFVDFYADIRPAFEEAGNVVNLMVRVFINE